MPAYLVAQVAPTVDDPYPDYRARIIPMLEKAGGRFLARGGETIVRHGTWDYSRLVIVEFPDMDTLQAFYDSPEYQEILPQRLKDAQNLDLFIEGYQG